MKSLQGTLITYCAKILVLVLLAGSSLAFASNEGHSHAFGRNKNIGVGNASDGVKARVMTQKRIFYSGDPLAISVRFFRGAELVSTGQVDASIVIFSPIVPTNEEADPAEEGTVVGGLSNAIVVPIAVDTSADTYKLFEISEVDISTLPAGTYQLGLILTKPEGDPLLLDDWYRGLLGLVDVVGLTIADQAMDFDDDGDGQVDDDTDGDGFSDDDDDDEDDDSSSD